MILTSSIWLIFIIVLFFPCCPGWSPNVLYSDSFLQEAHLLHWNGPFKPWNYPAVHLDLWEKWFIPDPSKKFSLIRPESDTWILWSATFIGVYSLVLPTSPNCPACLLWKHPIYPSCLVQIVKCTRTSVHSALGGPMKHCEEALKLLRDWSYCVTVVTATFTGDNQVPAPG